MPELKTSNYLQMILDIAPEIESCEKGHLKCKSIPSLTHIIFAESKEYVLYRNGIFFITLIS